MKEKKKNTQRMTTWIHKTEHYMMQNPAEAIQHRDLQAGTMMSVRHESGKVKAPIEAIGWATHCPAVQKHKEVQKRDGMHLKSVNAKAGCEVVADIQPHA